MKTKEELMQYLSEEMKTRADELAAFLIEEGKLEHPEIAQGRIVCETWLVSEDMRDRLRQIGECVGTAFNNHYWFRCATGLPAHSDNGLLRQLGATWK